MAHASGHETRLNRPMLVKHGGFGSDTYAREELRAEMGAMMAGEQLGVGHEPRHGHSYVASWVKALENDPKEIRYAAVDAQKASDWIVEQAARARAIEKSLTIERPESRVIDERDPNLPPPPTPIRGPEPVPTMGPERETPAPSR